MKFYDSQNSAPAEFQVTSQPAEELSESIKFFPYDRLLRTLGSLLQQAGFTEYVLTVSGTDYTILGKGAVESSAAPSLLHKMLKLNFSGARKKEQHTTRRQLRYSITDLLECETERRSHRHLPSQMPDPYSTSQILRGVGCFLDKRKASRLLGVTVKNRWVAIDYVTADGRAQNERQELEYYYDYYVNMYMQRSDRAKLPPPSEPTLYVTWESGIRRHRISRYPH